MSVLAVEYAGGLPGSANQERARESLQRAIAAKARVERRRRLADEAHLKRRPGETLAAAVVRIEREAWA